MTDINVSLKIAFIGCGRVASLLEDDPLRGKPCTHAGAFSKIEGILIDAACDIDSERLKTFGEKWGIPENNRFIDYKQLLAEHIPDVLVISTWTESHAEITLYAINRGVKTILCEKPVASNLKDAKEMMDTAKKNNAILIINHERRWDVRYHHIKKIIESGEAGEIRTVVANVLTGEPRKDWHADLEKVGGGPLLHDGTHLMDMLRYYLGDAEWVVGKINRKRFNVGIEHTAHAMIYFPEHDTVAFVEGGGRRHYFNFEIDIQCSRGRFVFGNEYWKKYISKESRRYTGFTELEPAIFDPVSGENCWISVARDAINAAKEKSKPRSDIVDGYKAMELVFAVYESAVRNGEKIYLPLKNNRHPLGNL